MVVEARDSIDAPSKPTQGDGEADTHKDLVPVNDSATKDVSQPHFGQRLVDSLTSNPLYQKLRSRVDGWVKDRQRQLDPEAAVSAERHTAAGGRTSYVPVHHSSVDTNVPTGPSNGALIPRLADYAPLIRVGAPQPTPEATPEQRKTTLNANQLKLMHLTLSVDESVRLLPLQIDLDTIDPEAISKGRAAQFKNIQENMVKKGGESWDKELNRESLLRTYRDLIRELPVEEQNNFYRKLRTFETFEEIGLTVDQIKAAVDAPWVRTITNGTNGAAHTNGTHTPVARVATPAGAVDQRLLPKDTSAAVTDAKFTPAKDTGTPGGPPRPPVPPTNIRSSVGQPAPDAGTPSGEVNDPDAKEPEPQVKVELAPDKTSWWQHWLRALDIRDKKKPHYIAAAAAVGLGTLALGGIPAVGIGLAAATAAGLNIWATVEQKNYAKNFASKLHGVGDIVDQSRLFRFGKNEMSENQAKGRIDQFSSKYTAILRNNDSASKEELFNRTETAIFRLITTDQNLSEIQSNPHIYQDRWIAASHMADMLLKRSAKIEQAIDSLKTRRSILGGAAAGSLGAIILTAIAATRITGVRTADINPGNWLNGAREGLSRWGIGTPAAPNISIPNPGIETTTIRFDGTPTDGSNGFWIDGKVFWDVAQNTEEGRRNFSQHGLNWQNANAFNPIDVSIAKEGAWDNRAAAIPDINRLTDFIRANNPGITDRFPVGSTIKYPADLYKFLN